MPKPAREFQLLVCLSLGVLLTGCVLGPSSLRNSRTNYNRAVQQTAREEMLLNLVRLKYHQSEEFLRVPSITDQYAYDADIGSTGTWQKGVASKFGLAFGFGAATKPTIVYTPEQAQEFNRRLLTPIGLETIDLLTSKGWAFDRVFLLTVRNINDVDNGTSAGGPTPGLKPDYEEFKKVCRALRLLQKHHHQIEIAYEDQQVSAAEQVSDSIAVDKINGEHLIRAAEQGFRFRLSEDGKSQTLWTRPTRGRSLVLLIADEAKNCKDTQEFREILELAPDLHSYPIKPDTLGQLKVAHASRNANNKPRKNRTELTVSTRSLKEMMFYLSHAISVPPEHVENGLIRHTLDSDGQPFEWTEMTGKLFRVHVHTSRPRNAAVAVKHHGYWFYVDESDLDSMSTFNLLLELFNLEIRAGGGSQIPLLTI